jgi:hypothetical protein
MDDVCLVTAADVQRMQGLAQRVTAARPGLVNSDASFGELAWIWGKGHASGGGSWRRRLWFAGDGLAVWGWAQPRSTILVGASHPVHLPAPV